MRGRHVRNDGHGLGAGPGPDGRVRWIDTARGLAILLVVSLHAASWLRETPVRAELWWDVSHVFATMRMPLLYACSGMLAAKWLTAAWGDLLPRKVTFLFWVYLIWQPLLTLIAPIASRVTGDELVPLRLLGGLILSPVRPRSELWFIWTLALFFVLARLFARVPAVAQLGVAATASALWFAQVIPEVNMGWDGIKYYLFFLVGIHGRAMLQSFAEHLGYWSSLALIGGWLLLSTADYVYGLDRVVGVGLAVRLLGVAAGIALALHLQRVALFTYLGARSLPIYLAHPLLLTCFTWLLLVVLEVNSPILIGLLPLIFTVAAIALSIQLHSTLTRTPLARYLYSPPPVVVGWVQRIFPSPSSRKGRASEPETRDEPQPAPGELSSAGPGGRDRRGPGQW